MDTAISNGDFMLDSNGIPISIYGIQEILQRALIRLTVRKGSFIYDTNLGSDLYKLKKTSSTNIKSRALSMVKEALKPMSNVLVDDVSTEFINSSENLKLNVVLRVNNNKKEMEVVFWAVHMKKY